MSESPIPTITTILEYIQVALKYIASGFIAVGTYMYLNDFEKITISDNSWFLILLASAIGTVTYAMHFATLDKYFNGLSMKIFIVNNNYFIPEILKDNIIDWEQKKGNADFDFEKVNKKQLKPGEKGELKNLEVLLPKLLFAMANQTYLRLMSDKKDLIILQQNLDKRIALLNFLYCSFYQVSMLVFYYVFVEIANKGKFMIPEFSDFDVNACSRVLSMVILALALLYSAREFNKRICSREMWIVSNYAQKINKV